MTRNNISYALIFVFFTTLLFSCTTRVFQPVEKQIKGTWLRTPAQGLFVEQWTFGDDGQLTVAVNLDTIQFISGADTLNSLSYSVNNKITKHKVAIQGFDRMLTDRVLYLDRVSSWIVNKVNSEELYLTSQEKHKGHFQVSFVKVQGE